MFCFLFAEQEAAHGEKTQTKNQYLSESAEDISATGPEQRCKYHHQINIIH